MSLKSDVPFNLDLLVLDEKEASFIRPVTSLSAFVGAGKNFHPDGLYSTEIFGLVGTAARSERLSYIDLRLPIIHPTIYKSLVGLRSFYKDILSAKEFAKFDPQLQDFVKSDMVDGRTGYEFFVEHLPKLKIPTNQSVVRQEAVALLDKYRDRCLIQRVVVIPAGLRDMETDDSGRATSDEINEYYYKLLAISNTINQSAARTSVESYNQQRASLQNTMMEIYEIFTGVVEGKKNLMMGKWAGRRIFNGTRNVISAMDTSVSELGHPSNVDVNDSMVGLYQAAKQLLPVTISRMRQGFLERVFSGPGAPAIVTDPNTLQSVSVQLSAATYADWTSKEGLEKQLTYFKEDSIRHAPIRLDDYYLGLCYRGPDNTWAFINGIEQLPDGRSQQDCTPISLAELIYAALYEVAHDYPAFLTRYPITGIGSIFASWIYLRSTTRYEERAPLNPDTWEIDTSRKVAYHFPVRGSTFFNSLSPHPTQVKGAGADFDGDTCSSNSTYSDEAVAETKAFLNSARAYVGTDGRFIKDTNLDTVVNVLTNMTGGLKYDPNYTTQQSA